MSENLVDNLGNSISYKLSSRKEVINTSLVSQPFLDSNYSTHLEKADQLINEELKLIKDSNKQNIKEHKNEIQTIDLELKEIEIKPDTNELYNLILLENFGKIKTKNYLNHIKNTISSLENEVLNSRNTILSLNKKRKLSQFKTMASLNEINNKVNNKFDEISNIINSSYSLKTSIKRFLTLKNTKS